jgi:hypothetical protein
MEVHRAPIHVNEFQPGQPEDNRPKTRCGYLVPEAYSCYETALGETGAVASGKALHFAADLVCSGGIDIWIRGAYSYAIQHISLANPRIFVYLKQRFADLDKKVAQLPQEAFYANPDVQATISETVLVLQLCPKRSKIVWPKVDDNTKRPGWLRGVAGSPETLATRTVWNGRDGDTPPLYLVGNELCKAITEAASERVLFWIRWTLEEDSRIRKETKGHGLTTLERGPAAGSIQGGKVTAIPPKQRSDAGHFIAAILGEVYKELAAKSLVRMHEEFGELMRLWRGGEGRMPARFRRDCLGLMALIVSEVPRWKVPAAPVLVEDPVRLARAVGQSGGFFQEVLTNPPLAPSKLLRPNMTRGQKVARGPKTAKVNEKAQKELSMEEHFDAYDAVMEAYLNRR